jgi:endonuclease-3
MWKRLARLVVFLSRKHLLMESESSVRRRKHFSLKHEETPFWKQYEFISKMRDEKDGVAYNAPVDTMGCDVLGTRPADNLPPDELLRQEKIFRYQSLLALMLSSQTKDGVVAAAMGRLKEHGCTVNRINETSQEKIAELIYPVSFYKRKSEYIKKVTKICKEQYDGDIPPDVESLQKLPGVGPKMAYLCMSTAWNMEVGIGVDTHVHRISNRLGWIETHKPEQTRIALEKFLPKENWHHVNQLLVGFGQTICTPTYPKCEKCLLSKEDGLCPYYTNVVNKKTSTKRKKKVKKEESEDEVEAAENKDNEEISQEQVPKKKLRTIPTRKAKLEVFYVSKVEDDVPEDESSIKIKPRKRVTRRRNRDNEDTDYVPGK